MMVEAAVQTDSGVLGVPGVQEPGIAESNGPIWSCAEHREIQARLYYAVTDERGYTVYRLLSIQAM
jgi:hypothetical protein